MVIFEFMLSEVDSTVLCECTSLVFIAPCIFECMHVCMILLC